jgi:hypothetical protein
LCSLRSPRAAISKVRGFAMADISLSDEPGLAPDDPKIDEKITKILAAKVQELIGIARSSYQEAQEAAAAFREETIVPSEDDPEVKVRRRPSLR